MMIAPGITRNSGQSASPAHGQPFPAAAQRLEELLEKPSETAE